MLATRDENGNMAIALAVLLILTNLALAVLARTLVTMHHVRIAQSYSAALAVADAGLSDALFKLDQNPTATFTATGSAANGTFSYVATRVTATQFNVQSKGIVEGSTHVIQATVSRQSAFPFALFGRQGLTFNGNGTANIYSYTTIGGPPTNEAHVGSNTAITVHSGAGAGDFQDYYRPATCTGCPHPVAHDEGAYPLLPVDWRSIPPATTQPCPVGGVFALTADGMGGAAFICKTDVRINGPLVVTNPPFKLYVTADHALDLTGALINNGGRAANVQMYKEGTGTLTVGTGNTVADVTFSGVLYAPDSSLTINGGKQFQGSIVVNQLTVNGAPNLVIGYDSSLGSILRTDWQISHYLEVPASSINF